ncbi:competence/damage-inducible protein A [Roseivirga sp. BDSF3-8]|uniref:competence/damage-inducible protein A n=1 Tax=Roseivirga sp. BDSF3-8 TaxID=3241598 RepID=UPI003531F033
MQQIKAEVLTIGDEILYGQILDTNTQWMSTRLDAAGIRVVRRSTIGDNREDILKALADAENRADIVLITGGLGPTSDDLTKPCLAAYFGVPLKMHEEALQHITDLFTRRGREMTPLNMAQAELPANCTMLMNENGSAPGMWFDERGTVFISMPGVPFEMKAIMKNEVMPRLRERFELPVIYHKLIRTAGIGESWLADKIKDWEDNLPPHIRLAYLPSLGMVRLRLTATGTSRTHLESDVQEQADKVMPLIEKYVYGYDEISLEEAVGNMLREAGKTLATAESCSGGYLAHQITRVPGSSDYFQGSIISYSNTVKMASLEVDEETLKTHGAVSEPVVKQMAEGARKKMGTDYALATSGVAGPGGGTDEKPVGTIWIACADSKGTIAKKLQLTTDRIVNIQYTAVAALNMLRLRMSGND